MCGSVQLMAANCFVGDLIETHYNTPLLFRTMFYIVQMAIKSTILRRSTIESPPDGLKVPGFTTAGSEDYLIAPQTSL